jgi:hypothetical protein
MNSEMMNSGMKFSRPKAQKAQRGQPPPKELKLSYARNENSPPLQQRVIVQEDKTSPVRDEIAVVPDRAWMAKI